MKKTVISLFFLILFTITLTSGFSALAVFPPNFDPMSNYIYLINTDTNTVIYEKNAHDKIYPASTTKMMTCLLAIENCLDLRGTNITISDNVMNLLKGTDSSTAGYVAGEQITMLDLLYGLMLPSGNECALAIAEYIGKGDIDKFVDMMNEKVSEIGMTETHFANPHGLHDDDHYTSAYDMYLLAKTALTYPMFKEICSSEKYVVYETNKHKKRTLYNTNYLIESYNSHGYYLSSVKGIKTGRTNKAGNCLVSTATKNGYTYICVTMGAPLKDENGKSYSKNQAFMDARQFYEWAFSELQLKEIVTDNQIIAEIPLEHAWNKNTITVVPEETFKAILPTKVDAGTVVIDPQVEEIVSAPVKKGDILGVAVMTYGNQELGRVNLVATESVDRNVIIYAADTTVKFVKQPWFWISAIVVIVAIVAYIIYIRQRFKRAEASRRSRIQRMR